MAHRKNQREVNIQGLIVPVAWDEGGTPLTIAISTFDEDEYIIAKDKKGDKLIELLREQVEVRGEVRVRDGVKTIKVKKYVLINKAALVDSVYNGETVNHARE